MRNPFAKPHTPGQWLLGSVCWTVAGAIGWLLICALTESPRDGLLGIVTGLLVQLLLWWRAVPRGRTLLEPAAYSWLVMLCWQWWLLLHVLLIVSFVLAIGSAITTWLFSNWPTT